MIPTVSLRTALETPDLLAGALPGDSFALWRSILIGAMGEPLDQREQAAFRTYTGREAPSDPVRELVAVVGRRGGKDKATAALCAWLGTCCKWPMLARGEVGRIVVIAPDQAQARIQRDYILGALEGSPLLASRVAGTTADTITLDTGIVVEVRSANFRRLRGVTAVAVVCSESAFWYSDESSANPDSEILAAVRPALLTTSGLLVQISTPYAKRGELFEAHARHYGKDSSTLVVQGSSLAFNPTLDHAQIERAYAEDATAAAAEYGATFRDDVQAFVSREVVEGCVDRAVLERQPETAYREYFGFVDPSGGSSDSMTLAIAHADVDGRVTIDCLREVVPPFSPESVVEEFCADLTRYGVTTVVGDRYAGEWPREQFRKRGVTYEPSDLPASDLFRELLPRLNTKTISLLDNPRAIGQLASLERRVGRNKDVIDHPRGAKNDIANAIAGVAWVAGGGADKRRGSNFVGVIQHGGGVSWRGERPSALAAGKHQTASKNTIRSVSKILKAI